MTFPLALIFSAIAVAAIAFAGVPLWRRAGKGRAVLLAALTTFMLGIAGGIYVLVGHPELAQRSLEKPSADDVRGLVSTLAWRMRRSPDDPRGWLLLGRGYLTLDDPADAAAAFKRAAILAPPEARPAILSAFGEALTASMGGVTPEAEAAFRTALAANPKDLSARFYLGQAYAERHDNAHALAMWEALLADTPAGAPWRDALLDRIAMLKASVQGPPDVGAMVQRLADRLKTYPNDPVGWRRLVKAYVVLGKTDKAQAALRDARKALKGDGQQLDELNREADELKLGK